MGTGKKQCSGNAAEMPDIFSAHAHHKKGFLKCRQQVIYNDGNAKDMTERWLWYEHMSVV